MKLKELWAMGKEALDAVKLPFEIAKAENDVNGKIIQLQQEVAELDLKIQTLTAAKPLNVDAVCDAEDAKGLKERRLKQAEDLKKRLF
jgi:hypothetical protein